MIGNLRNPDVSDQKVGRVPVPMNEDSKTVNKDSQDEEYQGEPSQVRLPGRLERQAITVNTLSL
jgi:hypothetical protein